MRSESQPRSFSRRREDSRRNEYRNRSESRTGETKKDFVTNKEIMEEIKKIKKDVNELKEKAVNVALIKEEEIEIQDVFFAENQEKADVMILDLGAPYSLVGKEWIKKYVEKNGGNIDEIERKKSKKKFCFGPGKVYLAEILYKIPVVVKDKND